MISWGSQSKSRDISHGTFLNTQLVPTPHKMECSRSLVALVGEKEAPTELVHRVVNARV